MKKKILLSAIILILLVCILGVYLNQVYLPVKIKSLIIEGIEENIGRKANLGSVRLNILKGIVLEDLSIFDEEERDRLFLEIEQVSFGWLFLPLLNKRQLIIPFVNIYSPKIILQRKQDGTFDIPSFKRNAKAKDKEIRGVSLIVYKINIKHAEINFIDDYIVPSYSQDALLDATLSLSLPQNIKYSLSGNIYDSGDSAIGLQSKGKYDLANKQLSISFDIRDINTKKFAPYYKHIPFILDKGIIQRLIGDATLKNHILNVSFNMEIPSLNLHKENIIYSGSIKADGAITYNVETKTLNYSGRLDTDKANLSGLPYIKQAKDISGVFLVSSDNIKTSNLQCEAIGTLFNIKGELTDFKNPHLSAKISSESVLLEKIKSILAENEIVDLQFKPEGLVKLSIDIDTQILPPQDLELKGEAILKGSKITLADLEQDISNIGGKVIFDRKSLSWQDLSLVFKKTRYSSSGRVLGFIYPQIDFDLSSSELISKATMQYKDGVLEIKDLKGKYLNSEFDIVGSLSLDKDSPWININSGFILDIADLKKVFTDYLLQYLPILNKLDVEGICNINLSARGDIREIRGLSLKAKLESALITVYPLLAGRENSAVSRQGFKLNNPSLNLRQEDMRISIFELVSDFYNGKIKLTGNADLSYVQPKFILDLEVSNLDLARLKSDTPLKNRSLAGLVSANLNLAGQGKDVANLIGKGAVSIKEGNLWEFTPFKKLGQFLVIPSFEKIVFDEAEADLVIEEGNIFSDQVVMKSHQVSLYGQGKMDFKGNLDYTIRSEFNPEYVQDSPDLIQILSSVIDKAKQFTALITTLKLTGTIKDPKFKLVPFLFEPFKRIKEIFE